MLIRQRKSYKLTQGFGAMKGVYRKPSDKKRETHIGNDADAPSEIWGDEGLCINNIVFSEVFQD